MSKDISCTAREQGLILVILSLELYFSFKSPTKLEELEAIPIKAPIKVLFYYSNTSYWKTGRPSEVSNILGCVVCVLFFFFFLFFSSMYLHGL